MATRTLKDDAIQTAKLLHMVEGGEADLDLLHRHLRSSLYRHRKQLGLSDADVAEIDNAGVQAFGGTPKGPPPDPE